IKINKVDIAAITVPKAKAPALAADLARWGVKGIWNFAPTDLNLPKEVTVENVHLAESLMKLSYRLSGKGEMEG
ncbi:MAG: redox-sensing transcriptional repressor Rex, partial [Mobilitalea sp.]